MSYFEESSSTPHVSRTAVGVPAPRQRRRFSAAETVGIALAVVGILVALLTWLFPQVVDEPAGSGPAAVVPTADGLPASTAPAGTKAPPPNGQPTYLNTVGPVSGKANTTALPRALQGQPGYEQAVVIGCPSNGTSDKQREVGYALRGRYLDLRATVRGYSAADPASRVEVSTLAGTRQRDGTLVWRETGRAGASGETNASLAASVEGAEELRVQVRCDDPEASLILVAPRLTPVTG